MGYKINKPGSDDESEERDPIMEKWASLPIWKKGLVVIVAVPQVIATVCRDLAKVVWRSMRQDPEAWAAMAVATVLYVLAASTGRATYQAIGFACMAGVGVGATIAKGVWRDRAHESMEVVQKLAVEARKAIERSRAKHNEGGSPWTTMN